MDAIYKIPDSPPKSLPSRSERLAVDIPQAIQPLPVRRKVSRLLADGKRAHGVCEFGCSARRYPGMGHIFWRLFQAD